MENNLNNQQLGINIAQSVSQSVRMYHYYKEIASNY
jgi:hypothetical protein